MRVHGDARARLERFVPQIRLKALADARFMRLLCRFISAVTLMLLAQSTTALECPVPGEYLELRRQGAAPGSPGLIHLRAGASSNSVTLFTTTGASIQLVIP